MPSDLDLAILAEEMGWSYVPACDEAYMLLEELEDAVVPPAPLVTPQLRPSTLRRANDFVAVHHRHCGRTARNGGKFAIEAVVNDELVGVVIVGNPLSATYMDGVTAEVTRLCINPRRNAPNLCSMLYSAAVRAWKAMGGKRIVTYTLADEPGASLRGAGFRIAGKCEPSGSRWVDRGGRRQEQAIYLKPKVRWERVVG